MTCKRKQFRKTLRKRISNYLTGTAKKPLITRLDADAIKVFEEYNLRAQDFLSTSWHVNEFLKKHPSDMRSHATLVYLYNKGKRL